ncbi:MAG TPA: hypothetical protein VK588_09725, partial [Chitinophagaceae bacterium]|nr:hypothetical protein [Chitinophagaceae bacterium]
MKIIETISSWNEITVKQFQGFYQVQCKTYNDEDERSDRLINIVYGLSQEEILSLSVASYKTLLLSISSLQNIDIPIGSKSEISVNGNRYCVELDTTKLPNASHMSVFKYFPKTDKEVIESLHYLVARVVCPLRKNIFGKWVKQKHEQRYFDQYCSDISQASVADVFS